MQDALPMLLAACEGDLRYEPKADSWMLLGDSNCYVRIRAVHQRIAMILAAVYAKYPTVSSRSLQFAHDLRRVAERDVRFHFVRKVEIAA